MKPKVQVLFDGKEIDVNSLSFTSCINDIGTFQAFVNGKSNTNIFEYFFKPIVVKIDDEDWFKGICISSNSQLSNNNYSLSISGVDDWYKLCQTTSLYYNYTIANSQTSLSTLATNVILKATKENLYVLHPGKLWDIFKLIINSFVTSLSTVPSDKYPTITVRSEFEEAARVASLELYKVGGKINIRSLLDNIIDKGISGPTIRTEEIDTRLTAILSNPSISVWSMILGYFSSFNLNLTMYKGKQYVFPSSPFLKAQEEITDIESISVDPFPSQIYTRVLIQAYKSKVLGVAIGSYPAKYTGDLTKLETLLGTINILTENIPIEGEIGKNYNDYAESIYINSLLKQRFARVVVPITNKFYCGKIVLFKDIFFNKEYSGQIYKIEQNIDLCRTTLILQYVIEKDERKKMDIKDNYINPLYPSFKGLIL